MKSLWILPVPTVIHLKSSIMKNTFALKMVFYFTADIKRSFRLFSGA